MSVFVDANVVMYAAGAAHPHQEPSRKLLERIARNELDAASDAEVLQEFLYRYWHLRLLNQGLTLVDHAVRIIPTILPVDKSDAMLARTLLEQHRSLEPRDAVHAAVMLHHGITQIYTYDRHFETIPGLTRLEPER